MSDDSMLTGSQVRELLAELASLGEQRNALGARIDEIHVRLLASAEAKISLLAEAASSALEPKENGQ